MAAIASNIVGVSAGSTSQETDDMATIVQGVVTAPTTTSYASGSNPSALMGKQADLIVSPLHGRHYTNAVNGNVFKTSVAAALTIPTTLATLASKFCLVNPAGSGKNMELIRFDFFLASATEVVNVIGLTKSTVAAAAVGTLTAGVINSCFIGGGTSVATFYTAATHVDTPVWYMSLLGIDATAVGFGGGHSYQFDGTVILPPGYMIDVVASTGAQANTWCDMIWAEVPT